MESDAKISSIRDLGVLKNEPAMIFDTFWSNHLEITICQKPFKSLQFSLFPRRDTKQSKIARISKLRVLFKHSARFILKCLVFLDQPANIYWLGEYRSQTGHTLWPQGQMNISKSFKQISFNLVKHCIKIQFLWWCVLCK